MLAARTRAHAEGVQVGGDHRGTLRTRHAGSEPDDVIDPVLDWALRSAATPYDDLNELSTDFGMGGPIARSATMEAIAGGIVAMDLVAP